jgi:hypothetical protein
VARCLSDTRRCSGRPLGSAGGTRTRKPWRRSSTRIQRWAHARCTWDMAGRRLDTHQESIRSQQLSEKIRPCLPRRIRSRCLPHRCWIRSRHLQRRCQIRSQRPLRPSSELRSHQHRRPQDFRRPGAIHQEHFHRRRRQRHPTSPVGLRSGPSRHSPKLHQPSSRLTQSRHRLCRSHPRRRRWCRPRRPTPSPRSRKRGASS